MRADLKLVRAMEHFVIKNPIFAGDYAFHLIKNLQNTIKRRSVVATLKKNEPKNFDRAKSCDSTKIIFRDFEKSENHL